jgi:hypothetical protein
VISLSEPDGIGPARVASLKSPGQLSPLGIEDKISNEYSNFVPTPTIPPACMACLRDENQENDKVLFNPALKRHRPHSFILSNVAITGAAGSGGRI